MQILVKVSLILSICFITAALSDEIVLQQGDGYDGCTDSYIHYSLQSIGTGGVDSKDSLCILDEC